MLRLMQKMIRDLWKYKTQFCSVFLMSLLGILIYTGIEGVWLGMEKQSDIFFKETNLSDLWVYGNALNKDDLSKINDIEDVRAAEISMILDVEAKSKIELKNDDNAQIRLTVADNTSISTPKIIEGEQYSDNSKGCWLDYNYAIEQNIEVGNTIDLSYLTYSKTYEVKGLIMSPEYISYTGSTTSMTPDHKKYGYCFISEEGFKDFLGQANYNQIKITLADNADIKALKEKIEDKLGSKFITCNDITDNSSISIFINQIKQLKLLSFMFSVLFILLSLLAMQTTMKRLVDNQKMQIGTMKALGFSNFQILLHYSLYGLSVSLVGSLIGFVLAPICITPILLNVQKDFYTMPTWIGSISLISYIIIFIVISSCTITTMLACRNGIKGMPAETMRDNSFSKGKNSHTEKNTKLWGKLSFEWKWSIRDIVRNKGRAIIGIIGVAGCMMLLIASLGMYDSLKNANTSLYGEQNDYNSKAIFTVQASEDEKSNVLKIAGSDGQLLQEDAIVIKTNSKQKTSIISIIDKGNYVHLKDSDGELITLPPEGVIVSNRLAEQLNINQGDNIKIRLTNDKIYSEVNVKLIIPVTAPQGIYISKESWEDLKYSFKPSSVLIGTEDVRENVEYMPGIKEIITLQEQLYDMNNVLDSAKVIVVLLVAAAIFLSIIILFNLGVLSFTERSREYATLKVLGYKQKEIRNLIFKDTMITTIIGWLLGIPIGLLFLKFYVASISTDTFEYTSYITIQSLLVATLVTIGCSLCIIMILSRKVIKIDMVEALKSVE